MENKDLKPGCHVKLTGNLEIDVGYIVRIGLEGKPPLLTVIFESRHLDHGLEIEFVQASPEITPGSGWHKTFKGYYKDNGPIYTFELI